MVDCDANNKADKPFESRYECPITGAHFSFKDLSERINKVIKERQDEFEPPKVVSKKFKSDMAIVSMRMKGLPQLKLEDIELA